MNVLSLFDGISCAYVALDRAGIPVASYHACEIDPHAVAISKKNHPDIIHLGDVRTADLPPNIDLLIGGSPCQDLSIAKKDRKGLDGDRSGLFWEYVRILKETQPLFFVLENVASMPKKDKDIITEALGVEPVEFNASLVSAQSRKRLFWTNIPFTLPEDRGILLRDILQPDAEVDESMVMNGKAFCLTGTGENKEKRQRTMVKLGHIGTSDGQANRVYSTEGKSVTLSALGGGLGAKTGLYRMDGISKPVVLSDSPLQILKEGRTELGKQSRREIRQQTGRDSTSRSGGHKAYYGREALKANCLTTGLGAEGVIVKDAVIRKLTPIECERLQGLPDDYTEGIAKTHRYKCVGNAFNVDVVAHILLSLHNEGV